jgi:hypothetical protein
LACYFLRDEEAEAAQEQKATTTTQTRRSCSADFERSTLLWATGSFGSAQLVWGMQVFLDLADWAHLLVESWQTLTLAFWTKIGSYLGIKIDPLTAVVLTFLGLHRPDGCRRDAAGRVISRRQAFISVGLCH